MQIEEKQELEIGNSQTEGKTQEILKFFVKKGFLLDKELLEFFANLNDLEIAKEILDKIS